MTGFLRCWSFWYICRRLHISANSRLNASLLATSSFYTLSRMSGPFPGGKEDYCCRSVSFDKRTFILLCDNLPTGIMIRTAGEIWRTASGQLIVRQQEEQHGCVRRASRIERLLSLSSTVRLHHRYMVVVPPSNYNNPWITFATLLFTVFYNSYCTEEVVELLNDRILFMR